MSKILQLVSKTFKGSEFTHEFTAKTAKARIIIEELNNVRGAHLSLKGRKKDVPIGAIISNLTNAAILDQKLIAGEKYKITFGTDGRQNKKEDGTYSDEPSSVELSVVWEDE